MSNRIGKYISGVRLELRKVSWLTKEQLINSTLIVGVFSILVAVFLFILDLGLSEFINILFNFGSNK